MGKTFGLLGEKLGHSFSPLIHGYLGDYDYSLMEIPPGELGQFMTERNFDGINVTIPYKQAVIPHCAALSEKALEIGGVNTIIKDKDGSLHGHNTDYHGVLAMLEGIDPGGKKVLVLGSGGSARAVRAALNALRVREVVTVSRRGEDNYGNIPRHFDAEIIINTTPVGMYPGNGNAPLSLEGFTRLEGVADLIYNPMRTALLLDAERRGIPCVNGLTMLVAQAEMACRIFTGAPARPELIGRIAGEIREKTQNIVLIGMPGCGKTTAGRALALKMGREFADTDELIETAAGKSIPRIFAEDGEETFRRLETGILREETKKNGLVIATGGGVVTRAENFDLLRQNGVILYLKRELSELETEGRPLSQNMGVRELAERRLPLYEAWSDRVVKAEELM